MTSVRWAEQASALCVVVFLGVMACVDLGRPFGNGDEVIYAQNIREMAASGDYGTLQWFGVAVHQRPVLPFSIAAALAETVAGEGGARLSSALFHFGTLLLVFLLGRRFWGRTDAAAVGAVVLACTPTFHEFGRMLMSDPPFVAAVVVALGATAAAQSDSKFLPAACAALGAAFAFKSLAAAVPGAALAPALVLAARRAPRRRWVLGVLLFFGFASPFYVAGVVEGGSAFLQGHFGYSLVARARGELMVGLDGGVLAYLHHMASADGVWPAATFALGSLGAFVVGLRERDVALSLVGGFAVAVFVLLSFLGTRLPHYLLPAYPAAALGFAGLVARGLDRAGAWGTPPRSWLAVGVAIALGSGGPARSGDPFPGGVPSKLLGEAAAAHPDLPLYIHEWWSPAVGYYAGRPYTFTTSDERFWSIVDDVDFIRAAGRLRRVPPVPSEPEVLVAWDRSVPLPVWWTGARELVEWGPYVLLRATPGTSLSAPPPSSVAP